MTQKPVLPFQIKTTNNQIRRLLERSAILENDANLTGMQYAVLGYIGRKSEQEPVFQKDIEAEFNIRRSTASSMMISLEKAGYIQRRSVASDARLKEIVMTEKARHMDKLASQMVEQLHDRLVRGISEEELALFYKVLAKIQQNAEE